jgi:hypothetical protein
MRLRLALCPLTLVSLACAAPAFAAGHQGAETIPLGGKIQVTCGGYANKNPHPNDLSIQWTSNTYAVVTDIVSDDHAASATYTDEHGRCTDSAGNPGPYVARGAGLYHVTVTTTKSESECTQTCGGGSASTSRTSHDVNVVAPCDGGLFSGVQTNKGVPLTDAQLDSTGIGQGLYPGQQISTGDLAVELDLGNGSVIRLAPDSDFTVPADCLKDKPIDSAFKLLAGELWLQVSDALGGQPYVSSENAVTGVRGSVFTAGVKGGKLTVHIVEGRGFYTTAAGTGSSDVPTGTTLVFAGGKLVQTTTASSAWPAAQSALASWTTKRLVTKTPPDLATPVPGAPVTKTTTTPTSPSGGGGITNAPSTLVPNAATETHASFWATNQGEGSLYSLESATLSSGGSPATGFKWNFGDAASGSKNTGSGRIVDHKFSKAGSYVVTLVVTTAKGSTTVRERVKAVSG